MTTVLLQKHQKCPILRFQQSYYQVENGHDRDGLGSEENYFWKTAKEREKKKNERKPFLNQN